MCKVTSCKDCRGENLLIAYAKCREQSKRADEWFRVSKEPTSIREYLEEVESLETKLTEGIRWAREVNRNKPLTSETISRATMRRSWKVEREIANMKPEVRRRIASYVTPYVGYAHNNNAPVSIETRRKAEATGGMIYLKREIKKVRNLTEDELRATGIGRGAKCAKSHRARTAEERISS